MEIKQEIEIFKQAMESCDIIPSKGLDKDVFLFLSTLLPIVNVDVLIVDRHGRCLLLWRDDLHCGKGWHVPGGCIRFKETLEERAKKTAMNEAGIDVEVFPEPIKVFQVFAKDYREGVSNQDERAHFITLVMACYAKNVSDIIADCGEGKNKKWVYNIPENFLDVQGFYCELWDELINRVKDIFLIK